MLIIKLGGSVIQNSLTEVNPQIFKFAESISKYPEKVAVSTGGGKLCRLFQNALRENGKDNFTLHYIGVASIQFQGEFVRLLLPQNDTYPETIADETTLADALKHKKDYKYFSYALCVPGYSSDYNTVQLAVEFESKKILKISNVGYVYDKDPRIFPEAQQFQKISIHEYMNLIGNPTEHAPGASYPFDPIGAQLAQEKGITIYFTSLQNFLKKGFIDFNEFEGTIIHP